MDFRKNIDSRDRPGSGSTAELMEVADKLSRFHRISWKEAFGKIAAPAFRLHRYRNTHNRLLQDALRRRDCPDAGECGA